MAASSENETRTIISAVTASNISTSETDIGDAERWILGIVGVMVWINGIVGNLLILVTLYHQPLLRSTHNIFLGNLALADLFIVGYGQPFWAVDVISGVHPTVNSWHCTVNGYLGFVCSVTSIVTLWTIACNRYLSVCHHAIYQNLVNTKKRALQICTGLWIGSALFSSIPFFGPGSFGYEKVTRVCFLKRQDPNSHTHIAITVCVFTILANIGFFNISIFRTWRQHKQRIGLWHSKLAWSYNNQVDQETREIECRRPKDFVELDHTKSTEQERKNIQQLTDAQTKVQEADDFAVQSSRNTEHVNESSVQKKFAVVLQKMTNMQQRCTNAVNPWVKTGIGPQDFQPQGKGVKTPFVWENITIHHTANEIEERANAGSKGKRKGARQERENNDETRGNSLQLNVAADQIQKQRSANEQTVNGGWHQEATNDHRKSEAGKEILTVIGDQKITRTHEQRFSLTVMSTACKLWVDNASNSNNELNTVEGKMRNTSAQTLHNLCQIPVTGEKEINGIRDAALSVTDNQGLSINMALEINTVNDKDISTRNKQEICCDEYQRINTIGERRNIDGGINKESHYHCKDYRWNRKNLEIFQKGDDQDTGETVSNCLGRPWPGNKCEQPLRQEHPCRGEKRDWMSNEQHQKNQRQVKQQRENHRSICEQNGIFENLKENKTKAKSEQLLVQEITQELSNSQGYNNKHTNRLESSLKIHQEQKIKEQLPGTAQEESEELCVQNKEEKVTQTKENLAVEENKQFSSSFAKIERTKDTRPRQTMTLKPADIALTRSLLAVYICLVLIYAVIVVVDVTRAVTFVPPIVAVTANLLFFVNSSINWLLYGAFSQQFRLAYQRQMRQWAWICCT